VEIFKALWRLSKSD